MFRKWSGSEVHFILMICMRSDKATYTHTTKIERSQNYALRQAEKMATTAIGGHYWAIGVACMGITFNNGKELARHAKIASTLMVDVFVVRRTIRGADNDGSFESLRPSIRPTCQSFA